MDKAYRLLTAVGDLLIVAAGVAIILIAAGLSI